MYPISSSGHAVSPSQRLSGLQKRKAGKMPSSQELAAIKRIEKAKDEENRRLIYRTVPKKHYQELSGRARKVLIDQSRFGLPVSESTIDLGSVLTWFHDLLARLAKTNAGRRFLMGRGSELDIDGDSEAKDKEFWQKRYQREKAKLARLDRLRREGRLIDSDLSTTCWMLIARRLKQVGNSLQKGFGPIPAKMLNEALEDCQREVDAVFSHDLENDIDSDSQ